MSWSNFTQRTGYGRPLPGRESVVHSCAWTVVHRPLGVNFRWNSAAPRRRPQRGDDVRPHPVDAAREADRKQPAGPKRHPKSVQNAHMSVSNSSACRVPLRRVAHVGGCAPTARGACSRGASLSWRCGRCADAWGLVGCVRGPSQRPSPWHRGPRRARSRRCPKHAASPW